MKYFNSKESVELRDARLLGYELGSRGIELTQIFGIGSYRIMAREELVSRRRHVSFEVTVRLL
jgi:hypothetical protein